MNSGVTWEELNLCLLIQRKYGKRLRSVRCVNSENSLPHGESKKDETSSATSTHSEKPPSPLLEATLWLGNQGNQGTTTRLFKLAQGENGPTITEVK